MSADFLQLLGEVDLCFFLFWADRAISPGRCFEDRFNNFEIDSIREVQAKVSNGTFQKCKLLEEIKHT